MTTRPRQARFVLLIGAVLVVTQACSVPGAHSQIRTGSDGMRTFTVIHDISGAPMLCTLGLLINPVHGQFEGMPGAMEPAWIVDGDGRQLSVVWPEGFAVRFDPAATLVDEAGRVVAIAGGPIELSQTEPGSAAGTYDDPYIASGLVFGGCYPYVK